MDTQIIDQWNENVKPSDTVYHLGDFAVGLDDVLPRLRTRLNGKITIVVGNHDRSPTCLRKYGFEAVKTLQLATDIGMITLRHDPKKFKPDEIEKSAALFHGHLHGQPHYDGLDAIAILKVFDVGIDALRRIAPVSLTEAIHLFQNRKHA